MKRYATVRVRFLNGGTGEAIRNMDLAEFEHLWRRFGVSERPPTRGIGAIGDSIVNFQWKIYREEPDYKPGIFSRLMSYKIRKALARQTATKVIKHSFDIDTVVDLTPELLDKVAQFNGNLSPEEVEQELRAGKTVHTNLSAYRLEEVKVR